VHEIALAIPGLPHYGSVRLVDIPISLLIAVLTAVIVVGARRLGSVGFHRIGGRLPVLLAGGLGVGLCAVLFHEISGKPLGLVLFSGQTGLGGILTQTSAAVVIGCLFAKAIAYALSIGAGFRGGPVFPSLFLGVTVGVLMTIAFSGFSITAGVAAGVAAAAAAALRTPFTGALLGALIVGSAGTNTVPLAIIAAVLAWLITLAASGSVAAQPETPSAPPAGPPSDPPSQAAT
jgi:H+/Cl- antiporter ClcA